MYGFHHILFTSVNFNSLINPINWNNFILQVEQLQESNQQVVQQNSDLEQLFKDSLSENRRLQDVISHLRQSAEKHCHDIQVCNILQN